MSKIHNLIEREAFFNYHVLLQIRGQHRYSFAQGILLIKELHFYDCKLSVAVYYTERQLSRIVS